MQFKPSVLLVLQLLLLLLISVSTVSADNVPLKLNYEHQVIAYIGDDQVIKDAANFLYKKRETVVVSHM